VDWQERPLIETFYEGIDSTRTKTVEESNSKNFENSKAEVDLVKSALQGDEVRARTRKNSQSTPTFDPMLFRAGETQLSCRHWVTLNRPGRPTSTFAQDATPHPAPCLGPSLFISCDSSILSLLYPISCLQRLCRSITFLCC
jgi:hypothetical protein